MTEIQNNVTTDQLKSWYVDERKTSREVGELLGISAPWARALMKQRGIPMRTAKDNTMPFKRGDTFSEEHKRKLSEAFKGKRRGINPITGRHRNYQRQIIECANCGKPAEKKRCHLKNEGESKYCSRKCVAIATASANTGKNNPRYTKQEVRCDYCGKNLIRNKAHVNKHNFCSFACNGKWKAENLTGATVYNFKGGNSDHRYYGEDWQRQKRAARERDNNTCQRCGVTAEQLGKNMDVHHIRPWRFFGLLNYKKANRLSNLKCLCNKCYKIEEEELPRDLGLIFQNN